VSVKYTMFKSDGKPVRATANIALERCRTSRRRQTQPLIAGRPRTYVVAAGDSLHSVAYADTATRPMASLAVLTGSTIRCASLQHRLLCRAPTKRPRWCEVEAWPKSLPFAAGRDRRRALSAELEVLLERGRGRRHLHTPDMFEVTFRDAERAGLVASQAKIGSRSKCCPPRRDTPTC